MEQSRSGSPGSESRQIFDSQSDNVMYLLRAMLRDVEQVNDPIDAIQQIIEGTAAAVKKLTKNLSDSSESSTGTSLTDVSTNLDALHKHSDEITAMLQANMRIHPFLFDWMLAMMVTFAEAYLESVLLALISAYPAWMATNDKVVLRC